MGANKTSPTTPQEGEDVVQGGRDTQNPWREEKHTMGWLVTIILALIVEAGILGSQGHLPSRKVVVRPARANQMQTPETQVNHKAHVLFPIWGA